MKSDIDLLNLYKEEKALVIGGPNERTGLEDFPSFKEWKLEYMKEYAETHDMDNPVTMEEAVAALEDELADDELLPEEDIAALAADPDTPTEEDDMTDETTAADTTPATPEATPEVESKSVQKRKAIQKKAAAKKKAPAKKVAATKRPPSKAKDAQKVFDRLYPKVVKTAALPTGDKKKVTRKHVIDEFVSKVGLTNNGAATYFQRMKKEYEAANGK
jgi:hypothetical protein